MLKSSDPPILENNTADSLLTRLLAWEWAVGLALLPAFWLPGWWSWGALALALAFKLGRGLLQGRWWQPTPLDIPITFLAGGALVGLLVSLDSRLSANRAWSLVGGLVVYYAVTASLTPKQAIRWALPGLAGVGVLVGLVSLVATDWGRGDLLKIPFVYDYLPHLGFGNLGSGASAEQELNPRVIAGILVLLFPASWLLAAKKETPRWLWLIAAVFTGGVLFLTQAPTAIGGIVMAAVLVWLLGRVPWWAVLAGSFAALVGGWFLLLWLLEHLNSTLEPGQRIVFRLEMWLRSLDMLTDRPFSGSGLNNFAVQINTFYPTYSLGPEAHAHNIILQTALDGGILGLIGFLSLLVLVAIGIIRGWGKQPEARGIVAAVATGTLGWLFYGVAESITLAHKPAVILWFGWGVVAVLTREAKPAPQGRKLTPLIILVGLVIGGLGLGLTWDRLQLDLAVMEGQKAVLSGDPTAQNKAATNLQNATAKTKASPTILDLQARLAVMQSDFPAATTYLKQEIVQDGLDTVNRYITAEWAIWGTRPTSEQNTQIRLYRQWRIRYPNDPLAYARLALAQGCPSTEARQTLQEGLSQTNSPFLQYLLSKVGC